MRDESERHRTKRRGPATIAVFAQPDRLADQRCADVDRGALPSDLAVVAHAPDLMVGAVGWLPQDPIKAPRRGRVTLGRRIIAERLVRPLLVVDVLEATQPLELFAQRARRRRGGVLQQCQMQALQPTILLRLAGGDAFPHHACLDELDRELRQSGAPATQEQNGGTLPQRGRCGRPNSRKAASSTGQTWSLSLRVSAWQRNR